MKWPIENESSSLAPHAVILLNLLASLPDLVIHLPLDQIKLDHRLKDQLGMDSIQVVSVLYELEAQYPHLTEEMAAGWKTVRDILTSMSQT